MSYAGGEDLSGYGIPLAPVIGVVGSLFGGKISEKEKWLRVTRADGHAAGSGNVAAVAQLLSAAKDSKYPERRDTAMRYLLELAGGKAYNGREYLTATPQVQQAAQDALVSLGVRPPAPAAPSPPVTYYPLPAPTSAPSPGNNLPVYQPIPGEGVVPLPMQTPAGGPMPTTADTLFGIPRPLAYLGLAVGLGSLLLPRLMPPRRNPPRRRKRR